MTQNEREEIFNRNKQLVWYIFSKINKSKLIISNAEEILQEGYIGLWNGTAVFNPEFGCTEGSLLGECIKRRMITYIQKYLYPKVGDGSTVVSTEARVKNAEELVVGDFIYEPHTGKKNNPFYKEDIISYTENYLRYHTKMPETFLKMRIPMLRTLIELMDMGYDTKEICKKMNRSKEWVSKAIKQVRTALRFYNYEAVERII